MGVFLVSLGPTLVGVFWALFFTLPYILEKYNIKWLIQLLEPIYKFLTKNDWGILITGILLIASVIYVGYMMLRVFSSIKFGKKVVGVFKDKKTEKKSEAKEWYSSYDKEVVTYDISKNYNGEYEVRKDTKTENPWDFWIMLGMLLYLILVVVLCVILTALLVAFGWVLFIVLLATKKEISFSKAFDMNEDLF